MVGYLILYMIKRRLKFEDSLMLLLLSGISQAEIIFT